MAHLLVLDGSNLVMRAFWGYPSIRVPFERLRQEAEAAEVEIKELPTDLQARFVVAVREMIMRILREDSYTHLIFAKDSMGPTWRHDAYSDYKGTRERKFPGPGYLVGVLEPFLDAWGICHLRMEGFEADDILASLAVSAKEKGSEASVVSGDSDILQLIQHEVRVLYPDNQNSGYVLATPEWVRSAKKYHVHQQLDWKILRGESSDNIPAVGIPSKPDKNGRVKNMGVSEREAVDLLERFGSLHAIYEAASADPQPEDESLCISDKIRSRILPCRESAFRFYELIKLRYDVPLEQVDRSLSSLRNLDFYRGLTSSSSEPEVGIVATYPSESSLGLDEEGLVEL